MLAFDTLWVCDVVQESSLLCCDDKKVIVVFVVFVVLIIFVVLVLSSSLSQWFPGHVLIHAHWCPIRGIAIGVSTVVLFSLFVGGISFRRVEP